MARPLRQRLCFQFGYGVAQAGKPAALALEVSGATTPAVEAFTELETKNPITLDASTTIEFLHYASCKTIIVQGGQLSFTEQRYLYKRGKVLGSKRAECPKSVAASGASQIGGLVLRGRGGTGVRDNPPILCTCGGTCGWLYVDSHFAKRQDYT